MGQKPISAIVDITNYVMIDLNRPLHAYDADKIDKGIMEALWKLIKVVLMKKMGI